MPRADPAPTVREQNAARAAFQRRMQHCYDEVFRARRLKHIDQKGRNELPGKLDSDLAECVRVLPDSEIVTLKEQIWTLDFRWDRAAVVIRVGPQNATPNPRRAGRPGVKWKKAKAEIIRRVDDKRVEMDELEKMSPKKFNRKFGFEFHRDTFDKAREEAVAEINSRQRPPPPKTDAR